jgi:eukaryotic-like serine/threonine-protein kinase
MAGKKLDVTSPTVEGHRPGASPPDGGPVDPSGATVSWHQGDPGGSEGGVPTPAEAAASGGLLRRVAQFVLLERLGGGGMGVVFAAFDEKLERKVAIKLVATQGGDGRAQERLLREAQAQARLSHPNVVTVYEVGALPEGQLFIAMELVKGETLREWQRSEKRSWQDILSRYAAAGEGLAAAHSSSIVHRDFKPDNILVGEDGRVRVADFGLAFAAEPGTPASRPPSISDASASGRLETSSGSPSARPGRPGRPGTAPVATAGRSARSPMLTAAGTVAGTPGYMAPEQLSGAAVDARTDQFSFCVALYEALYDERPYADFAFLHEERPAMRRSDPDPSHPRWLWDVIVRGLSLEPDQRFASMDELLALLTRNRDLARRRTRLAGLTLGATAVIGISIAVLTARQAPPPPCPLATDELTGVWDPPTQQRVETALLGTGVAFAANVWASTQGSFDRYSQRWLKAHQAACEATNVRHVQSAELLDRRMECLAGRKRSLAAAVEVMQLRPSQAVARAGEILSSLGEIELCADTGALIDLGAMGSTTSGGTADPAESARRQAKMNEVRKHLARASAFIAMGDLASTESEVREAAALEQDVGNRPLRAELRFFEGRVKLAHGSVPESISIFERAVELAISSRHDELSADIWLTLAREVGARELKPAQIEAWLGQGEAWVGRLGHARDPRRVLVEYARGNLQLAAGSAKEGLETLTRVLESAEALWGSDDPRLIPILRDRALAHARLRQAKDAVADGERALAIGVSAWGGEYPDIARTRRALGLLYIEQLGDVARGEKEIEQARKLYVSQLGPDSIEVANCEQALSQAGHYRGDYASALEHAERAEQIYLRQLGPDHPRRGESLVGVGVLRFMRKDFEGALSAYQTSLTIMRDTLGEDHATVAVLRSNLGEALLALGRSDDALVEFQKALQVLERSLGAEHADLALPLKGLGLSYLSAKRFGDAMAPLERAFALRTRSAAANDPQEMAEIRWALARTLLALHRSPERARQFATDALATYKTLGSESAARVSEIARWLQR